MLLVTEDDGESDGKTDENGLLDVVKDGLLLKL